MSPDWEAAIEAIADPRDRRAVRALLDVAQHHLGDFTRERGPRPQGRAPDAHRWEVQADVEHEPDVVSYLVDAPDREAARARIGARTEVEAVHEVIHVFGRAEP